MDAKDGQAQLDAMGDELLGVGQELADAALSYEEVSIGDLVESKPKFQCPDCNKSYTTKKSLQRHLSSTGNACAKEYLTQEQVTAHPSKPRWACSRCGKDCATNSSVERHISKSCWRACDECTADGITRCDSVTKTGPCRTCEGKGRPCTKHTSAIPGTKAVRWIGAAARPQLKSTTEDEDMSTSDQKPAKRKTVTSPETSPERAHKNKRPATADQQVVDYGSDRVYDHLGGQACVPSKVKRAAVSDWLDEQSNKSASAASTHAQVQNNPSRLDQFGLVQNCHFDHQQPDRSFDPTRASGGAPPSPNSFLPSQHGNGSSTPSYQQQLSFPPTIRNHHAIKYVPTASSGFANLPHPPLFGGLPSMTVGQPMQFDQMYFQMQTLRHQNQAHDLKTTRQNDSRNGTVLPPPPPPFGVSGPLDHGGQGFVQAQGRHGTSSRQAPTLSNLGPSDSVLVLRIHSNTHDKNGQPVFSILRMRSNETFGPRLDAYCVNRGKEYGLDWMFVYRYQTGTYQNPGHDMQITLTWDMTPADVKIGDVPGVVMRNMDTIYVMQAKPPTLTNIKREMGEGGAVQSPGPQVSHETVDITDGETEFYQNPDVTRQWSQAIQKDNTHLCASHHQMKTVITQLKQDLFAKNQQNTQLNAHIAELTKTSKEYRESVQRRLGNATAPDPGPQMAQFSLSRTPAGRVARQRPGPPNPRVQQRPLRHPLPQQITQQTEQTTQRSKAGPNDFAKKCEAVRDPQDQAPQLEPLTFPSGSTVPDYTHELSMDFAYNSQDQNYGRFCDAVDKVAAEGGVEEMEEE